SVNPTRRAQPSLFQAPSAHPSFQRLPPDTQAKTVVLLARLLRHEADRRVQAGQARAVRDDKVKSQHLGRKAILYVRQSSAYQVHHNLESQRLQYAMQERLHQLGWHEVDVVDEDLGRSAAGMVVRTGFERMVAEVCLGKVGAVAAREVSRFARNSREGQQLVEVCSVFGDETNVLENVFSPATRNRRL